MDVTDHKAVTEVQLEKELTGFGFNVVGGSDNQHIPGDSGIFITKIRPDTPAFRLKNLSEGDRILAVNNDSLVDVTHEQAVEVFKKSEGLVKFKIEVQAERTALERLPEGLRTRSEMASTSTSGRMAGDGNATGAPRSSSANPVRQNNRMSPTDTESFIQQRGGNNHAVGKKIILQRESVPTEASTLSKLEDPLPPPTPTFDYSNAGQASRIDVLTHHSSSGARGSLLIEDPRGSESLHGMSSADAAERKRDAKYYAQEIVYTLVGLAAITTVGFFVYRRFSRH